MTSERHTTIYCDEEWCGEYVTGQGSAIDVRLGAPYGWVWRNSKRHNNRWVDLCPAHSKAPTKGERDGHRV